MEKKNNKKDNDNKAYGDSVLLKPVQEQDDKVYEKMEYNYSEEDVKELKSSVPGNVTTKVIRDAISGKQIGINLPEGSLSDTETVESIVNKKEIAGKSLSLSAVKMIEELLGHETPKARVDAIENKFKEISGVSDISTAEIEDVLGSEIVDIIKKKIFTSDNYMQVVRRFFEQLYENYVFNVQYNDDIRSLNDLYRLLNELDLTSVNPDSYEEKAKELEAAISKLKDIEKANKGQKMKYTIDDIQCNIIESVRTDLLRALQLSDMYVSARQTGSKFKKDLKKLNKVKSKIATWISQIRSDEDTIYTFPIIEDFGIVDMNNVADNFIIFILNILLAERLASVVTSEDELSEYDSLEDYYMDKAKLSKQERQYYYESAALFAYLLCRTYKVRDITNNSDRRVLSYVLDMVSKANYRNYRTAMTAHVFALHEIVSNS